MTWEQLLPSIALVIALAGAVALARWYLPSYLAEKAKGLATKEDIAEITREVEQVRHEYARHLEELVPVGLSFSCWWNDEREPARNQPADAALGKGGNDCQRVRLAPSWWRLHIW